MPQTPFIGVLAFGFGRYDGFSLSAAVVNPSPLTLPNALLIRYPEGFGQ